MTAGSTRFARLARRPTFIPPRVRWSEPHGLCTGQVQCASDYIAELADNCWMTTTGFWIRGIQHDVLGRTITKEIAARALYGANHLGLIASSVTDDMRRAGFPSEYGYLSLVPLQGAFPARGRSLLAGELRWCKECWRLDELNGERPYVRLLWLTEPVLICPVHQSGLENKCGNCGRRQRIISPIPRGWICRSCGRSLYEKVTNVEPDVQHNERSLWKAKACERLIQRVCSSALSIGPHAVRLGFIRLIEQHGVEHGHALARLVNIPPQSLGRWMEERAKVPLKVLLEICYRLDVLPDEFLDHQDRFPQPPRLGCGEMASGDRRRKFDVATLSRARSYLDRLLSRYPKRAPATKEVAKRLCMTYMNLRLHFPEHYRVLRQRHIEWTHRRDAERDDRRVQRLKRGVVALIEKNMYPSERHLKTYTDVLPSDLRRPEIRRLLSSLQRKIDSQPQKRRRKLMGKSRHRRP